MIRAIIIDDEKNSREYIQTVLQDYCPDVEVITTADSVATGIDAIKKHSPDLIFLDIQMPGGDGFELLGKFPQPRFDVIFITAYDHYAIKAFEFSALDYLLKPVDISRLQEAVGKIIEKKDQDRKQEKFEVLIENLKNVSNQFNKIMLPNMEGFTAVEVREIIRCEGDVNYTKLFLMDGSKILISKTLKELENLLEDFNFCRIHKSHLVNLNNVKSYTKGRGGYVVMDDGTKVDVSRNKKKELIEKFNLLGPN